MSDTFTMLGRVAAGIAHDLANYLGAVELALTMVEREGTDRAARSLTNAREVTARALRLTRCLRDYARGGSPDPEPVDLAGTVRSVLELFGRSIPERLTVAVELEEGLPRVTGVGAELEQLVLNLVLNACEAMPGAGTLTVTVRRAGGGVALLVGDSGGGSSAFPVEGDAVSPSTKSDRPGGGLGLGIVRRVASQHAARIEVTAQRGGGTSILVVFPTDEVGSRRARGQGYGHAGHDVLVVDDDEETREFFRELLRHEGFVVHTAENGRAALEWLDAQARPPACIILDLEMPVMNGWHFMQCLARRREVPPVVVVSGAPDPPSGAALYLAKPPPFERLIRAVQACCGEPTDAGDDTPGDALGGGAKTLH